MENVNGHDKTEETQAAEDNELKVCAVSLDELKKSFISEKQFIEEVAPLVEAVMDKCKELGISMVMHTVISGVDEDGDEGAMAYQREVLGTYVPNALIKTIDYFKSGASLLTAIKTESNWSDPIYQFKSEKLEDGGIKYTPVASAQLHMEESEAANEQAA